MPTYEYRCSTCSTEFEIYQSFSEDALKKCPTKKSGNSPEGCTASGRGKVEKVFSAPGISFKGEGFYKNDSRSGSKKSKTADSPPASESKSDTKSETKSSDSKKPEKKASEKPKSKAAD